MSKSTLIIMFFFISTIGFGHETNKAFFEIINKDSIVEFHCEFPWTIRRSLMAFDTSLVNSKSKKDFENAFKKYIKENLTPSNSDGINLKFVGFTKVKNEGHSHANKYLITFRGSDIKTLKNTIMFNIFNNQENHHTYKSNNRDFSFSTKNAKPNVNLSIEESEMPRLWMLFGLIPIVWLAFKLTRKKTS